MNLTLQLKSFYFSAARTSADRLAYILTPQDFHEPLFKGIQYILIISKLLVV